MRKLMIAWFAAMIFFGCAAPAWAAASLQQQLSSDIRAFDGKVGIYAKNLRTNKSYGYNEDTVFPTASTSKLVVALAVYKYLYPKASGDKLSLYDTDVQYMMTVSDNAAFYELLDELNSGKFNALNQVIRDLRLKKTMIHSDAAYKQYQYHSVTTPYEMARVFESIYWEKYVGKNKSVMLKDELANTIFQDEIPRYMLTKVMHKVGELDDVLCDVGIVDDGKDQILISVYTKSGQPEGYASDFIASASAKLYNLLRRK